MNPISLSNYKLSCELIGHSMDVRSVTQGKNSNIIISGSRDKSAKIWVKEGENYSEFATLKNHTNFISCVYYLESENWICTGSNDSTICIYRENTLEPFVILRGHQGNVCALYKGLKSKELISGSWDKTGKIWTIDDIGTSTFVNLQGHEAAVWAVTSLPNANYVTGSADKQIFYWNSKGEKLRILKGHTDCVRGLIGLPDGSLISCGNDACIKYWNDDGECVREFHGHANYIYTMHMNLALGTEIFVSGGEDSSIRMWSTGSGNMGDSIILPAQSIWSVTCLNNGDIVTGSSDGIIRIFTQDPKRVANQNILKQYNLAVETRKLEQNKELGGIKVDELPGPESLLQAGKDGQTKIVRHPDGKIMCYQFEQGKWNELGNVMGASGGTQETSGKTLYEGKEYDYVFSVDISDTEPPIKLPYNRGEDPWLAAQAFIHKNSLPQAYLEQVANFIMKNSDTPVIQQSAGNSGYQDPFTGENRYVPSSNINNFDSFGNVDPFTGSSSYSTEDQPNISVNFTKGDRKHFPISSYVTFDNCDASKVLVKLIEFSNNIDDPNLKVNETALKAVIKLTEKVVNYEKLSIETLLHLLKWKKEYLFPVLDVARLAIRHEQIYCLLNPVTFLDVILQNLTSTAPNQLMAIRCITNLMCHPVGRQNIEQRLSLILDHLQQIKEGTSNLQVACATFYLNLAISQTTSRAEQEKCQVITEGILEFLKWSMDLEACYRALQALGNLSCTPQGPMSNAQIISVDYVVDKIKELAGTNHTSGYEKVSECANALLTTF